MLLEEQTSRSSFINAVQGKKMSSGTSQAGTVSIRQLTFEALKVLEQANRHGQDVTLKKAKLSLNELITKSLASSGAQKACLSAISVGKEKLQDHAKIQEIPDGFGGPNKDRYKTELCRKFMENSSCPYSKKCQFAHGYHELRPVVRHPRYRTELCREFFNHGLCTYGTRCNFIHQLQKEESTMMFTGNFVLPNSQHERPNTPSNDSGLSLNSYSPMDSTGGRFSPIESTRISDRSESPSDLVAIQEIEEQGSC